MASSKGYRPLPSDIRLYFNAFTKVKLKTEETEDIPTYRFIFTDLDDMDQLQKRCGKTTYTTGVIGKLRSVKAPEIIRKRSDVDALKTDITIENERGARTTIALWGDTANPVHNSKTITKGQNVMVIVTDLIVDKFSDSTQVDVIHNNKKEMESIDALLFKNRIIVMEGLQLLQDSANNGTTFTIKATVIRIVERSTWFYMACSRCTKAHLMKDGYPWCNDCAKKIRNPVPRYKLQLMVTDNATPAVIIVSGPATEPLLDNENMAEFVLEIVDTLGKSFIFEVHLNEKSFGYSNFSVRKLYPINHDLEAKYELRNMQQALPTNGTANMDGDENMKEIIALADLAEKGLQSNDAAETGKHVDTEKGEYMPQRLERENLPESAQHGDNENLEDEAALAELEAGEKACQNGQKGEYMPQRLETAQHGDNENLEMRRHWQN
ncbi:uncharacterized protein LOC113279110 [Papaver somniferum]|uniref:uncharacterized protein LOC113279110 n=1 Tax=Papaver somniferum TaxID=3469 RepID=UPI000E7006DE|nr:uncharacterized protein LOC113279110 [Papaver somniferum]